MKKFLSIFLAMLMLAVAGCSASSEEETGTPAEERLVESEDSVTTEIRFTDDLGKEIVMDKAAEKVISLYSVHTENLYALGAGDAIIGVGTSDKYPEEVLTKPQYSYKDDAELIIAANPDVVLIRSMIANRYPDYVKVIEQAGITVVTLYCSEYDDFDAYLERLGMLVGRSHQAEVLLTDFHAEIDEIKAKSATLDTKKNAYFESIGSKFKTATPESFAGTALEIVGLNNLASDVEYDGSTTVVTYGEEALLAKSKDIDVYIAQKGAMNRTVSLEEIKARPGFMGIKAVEEGHVLIMDEKLISGATMRYIEGLKLLQKEIYGVE